MHRRRHRVSFRVLLGGLLLQSAWHPVAVRAVQDTRHRYNEAIEIAMDEEMKKLGIQPARVAKEASERVKGDWYTGCVLFFVDIKKRNLDIGLDDGYFTPTLLPGVGECPNAAPTSYPVPTLDALTGMGSP